MAEKLTPAQRAAEIVETKRLTLAMLASDTEIAEHEATLSRRKALVGAKDRHVASMADYESGNATVRAIEAFKVKAHVASVARASGLQPNGMAIPAPVIKTDAFADVEGDAPTA